MKNVYMHKCSPFKVAVLDCYEIEPKVFMITRLHTPEHFRKQGIATKLMQECCEDADRARITLCLFIVSYGDMDNHQLAKFYERFGFVKTRTTRYDRRPRHSL